MLPCIPHHRKVHVRFNEVENKYCILKETSMPNLLLSMRHSYVLFQLWADVLTN